MALSKTDQLLLLHVAEALQSARDQHRNIAGLHEGYAVIWEELEEFWEEVRKRNPDADVVSRELFQVAAMAVRTIADVVCEGAMDE